MDKLKIDETKLPEVMALIERGTSLMEESSKEDEAASAEIEKLTKELRALTGKETLEMEAFFPYWSWTDLETVARSALMPIPKKVDLKDEEIGEIIRNIAEVRYSEAETGCWLEALKKETGLCNISDYIFWPNEVGLKLNASIEEIIEKVLEDRSKGIGIISL